MKKYFAFLCLTIFFSLLFIGFKSIDKSYYKFTKEKIKDVNKDSVFISGRIYYLAPSKLIPVPYGGFGIAGVRAIMANDSGCFEMKVKPNTYKFVFLSPHQKLVTRKITISATNKYYFVAYLDNYSIK